MCRRLGIVKLPLLTSLIRRRLLVNFRVDPAAIQRVLLAPFRPQLVDGAAVAGVCLIRLEQVRPAFARALPLGISSQNAAHRIAVTWPGPEGETQKGVYITRRDTASTLVRLAGGRLFPGAHHHAKFDVVEGDDILKLDMVADDGTAVAVNGKMSPTIDGALFKSVAEASAFFEAGALGYSPAREPGKVEGFRLETRDWRIEPFHIDSVHASFYEDDRFFPSGSVVFDHALIMRNVVADWRAAPDIENV